MDIPFTKGDKNVNRKWRKNGLTNMFQIEYDFISLPLKLSL